MFVDTKYDIGDSVYVIYDCNNWKVGKDFNVKSIHMVFAIDIDEILYYNGFIFVDECDTFNSFVSADAECIRRNDGINNPQ